MTAPWLCAVIGRPVRHSLSPVIHAAAFEAAGLDWAFTRFEIVDGGVEAVIAAMPTLRIRGLAVTMPHKEAAALAVDVVSDSAQNSLSVNTVTLRDDGSTLGSSTDGDGFVRSVAAAGYQVAGSRVVIIGAGAAARSIVHALDRAGAAEMAIVNRTPESAAQLAALAPGARVGTPADLASAGLVVNATSVGMGTDELPVDPDLLRADHVVADIVYHPLDTALLTAARAVGARTIDGLGMLVHQAALQQELWTGRLPDADAMRSAAERALRLRR